MFFDKKRNGDALQEAPLEYWEEKSYMMALSKDSSADLLEGIFERVAAIGGVKLKAKSLPSEEEERPGIIILTYEEEEYEIGYFVEHFQWNEIGLGMQNFFFSEEEIAAIKAAKKGLTIFMKFREDSKKSFHLQLKLAVAMVPELAAIFDESAEKMISAKWAVMAAESSVTPGPEDLYAVQAVSNKRGEVWLHTHGLCRCGITELEILQSNKKHCNDHHHLLSAFAGMLLEKKEAFIPGKSSKFIGILSDERPVEVTYLPWTEGIREYKKLSLGGPADRKTGHHSRTGPIFLYEESEDSLEVRLGKVTEYDKEWGENPMFFFSNEETERMQALARERFHFVREYAMREGNQAIIKVGLLRDDNDGDLTQREHIWFELMGFEGEGFRAKLIQEPYAVAAMHEGDEGYYTLEEVTDWLIYTPEFPVKPSTAYLLQ